MSLLTAATFSKASRTSTTGCWLNVPPALAVELGWVANTSRSAALAATVTVRSPAPVEAMLPSVTEIVAVSAA